MIDSVGYSSVQLIPLIPLMMRLLDSVPIAARQGLRAWRTARQGLRVSQRTTGLGQYSSVQLQDWTTVLVSLLKLTQFVPIRLPEGQCSSMGMVRRGKPKQHEV